MVSTSIRNKNQSVLSFFLNGQYILKYDICKGSP